MITQTFQELSTQFAATMMHFLWQGLVIAALAAALVTLFGRNSPRTSYFIHCVALLLMLCCLPITWMAVSEGPSAVAAASVSTPEVAAITEIMVASPASAMPAVPPVVSTENVASPAQSSLPVSVYLVAAYVVGLLAMLLRLVIAFHGGRELRGSSTLVDDASVLEMLQRSSAELGLRSAPAIAFSERVLTPVVVGILKPMVLLPFSIATQLTPAQLETVITHELAHIKRGDHVVLLLQRVIEAILFFHPAVWWISRQIDSSREHCCDDLVLKTGAEPTDYAESLVIFSELRQAGLSPEPTLQLAAAGNNGNLLRRRVLRILGQDQNWLRLQRPGVIAAAIVAGIALVIPIASVMGGGDDSDKATSKAEWSKVLEVTIGDIDIGRPFPALDLQTGQTIQITQDTYKEKFAGRELIMSEIMEPAWGLVASDLQGAWVPMNADFWEKATIQDVRKALDEFDRKSVKKEREAKFPPDQISVVEVEGMLFLAFPKREGMGQTFAFRFKADKGSEVIGLLQPIQIDESKGATIRIKRLGVWSDAEVPAEPVKDSGFYPTRQQFLVDEDSKDGSFLVDFDTGKLFSPPGEDVAKGEIPLLRWVDENGIDAVAQLDPKIKGLVGMNIAAISVNNSDWNMSGQGIQAKGLRAMLGNTTPGNPVELTGLGELPRTYAIRTREGGNGLLQILGIEDEKLKIQYKMLKPVSQPLRFVPEAGRAKETNWNKLQKFQGSRVDMMTARVAIGGEFPISRVGGETYGKVKLLDGDDAALRLRFTGIKGEEKFIRLDKGKSQKVSLDDHVFKVLFPKTSVAITSPDTTHLAFLNLQYQHANPELENPIAIATEILEPLGRGDIERHFELTETPEDERAETEARIRKLDFKDLKVTHAYVGGVESLVIFDNGKKNSYGVKLKRETGDWKFSDVELFSSTKGIDNRLGYFRKRVFDAKVVVAASESVYKDVYLHVLNEGRLCFEGEYTNWSEVEGLMKAVPDRANTALVVVEHDSGISKENLTGRADKIVERIGFRALVYGGRIKSRVIKAGSDGP